MYVSNTMYVYVCMYVCRIMYVHACMQSNRSGQQILLGDRVVVKGEQLGTIKYIGKLEFDPLDRVFIGVHLDAPVGITDGAVKGKRYFQCPPLHGVFLLPHDILCVTGRKVHVCVCVCLKYYSCCS